MFIRNQCRCFTSPRSGNSRAEHVYCDDRTCMKTSTDVLRKLLSFQCRNWKSNRVRGVFVVIRIHAVKKTKHPGAVRDSAKIGAVFRTKYPWITNSVAVDQPYTVVSGTCRNGVNGDYFYYTGNPSLFYTT